jgi:hypothetical protein
LISFSRRGTSSDDVLLSALEALSEVPFNFADEPDFLDFFDPTDSSEDVCSGGTSV